MTLPRLRVPLAALAALITGATLAAAPATASTTGTVLAASRQTITGFGVSGAWWTIDLARFPTAGRAQVARLLFAPDGIALSQYRWNIGGGGTGVTVPTDGEPETGAASRAPETFLTATGYDWTRDPGGTDLLRRAAAYHVPDLIGFGVGGPAPFTTNGKSCGGTLRPEARAGYADYLATVVAHARTAWHANIDYVSPINEPDYTRDDCTQEGMAVPPAQRAGLVTALHDALARRAPGTRVIADESSRVDGQFLTETPTWMADRTAAADTAALAHHTYDFPTDATLNKARDLAAGYHKPLWATEICCANLTNGAPTWGQGYDPTITGGLALADIVASDLAEADDSAFQWWVAMSAALGCDPSAGTSCTAAANAKGWNDGLIYYDPHYGTKHNTAVYPTKRLWALGNFSRFVRPGAVRHEVTGAPAGVRALAFRSGGQWSLIVVNNNATATAPLTLAFPGRVAANGAWRTDATHDLSPVAPGSTTGRTASVPVPGHSITTYRFDATG